MIKGTGVDLVKIKRISDLVERWQDHFLNKIFSKVEIDYCKYRSNSVQHFAARFAAKEAVVKMLGTGFNNIKFKDIEIFNKESGKPEIRLYEKAKQLAEKKDIKYIHLSLSHEKEYAIAQVIAEGN